MKTLLIAALMALIPMQADAEFHSGSSLLENVIQCDKKDQTMCAYVYGYVVGVKDAYEDTASMPKCAPYSLKKGELKAVVEKWLNDHPERLHEPAAPLILTAINEAWPCPE